METRPLVGRVFLLSPARCSGPRATGLVHSQHALGQALRSAEGAPLGEVFTFLSSLYFRGKLSYASHFGASGLSVPGALIITPGHGLCRPVTRVRAEQLAAIGRIEVEADNPGFVEPLVRDAGLLLRALPDAVEVVLLGSIATPKYVEPLLSVLGPRLSFPREFVGRGDMSRGGMLLRATREGRELAYAPVSTSVRTGARARRLGALRSDG
jgi:hypothetical protein